MTEQESAPVVRVRGLSKTFTVGGLFSRRSVRALAEVDLDVGEREIVALVGESGSGKSTLARVLARLEQPTSGTLEVAGEQVLKTEPRRASRSYRSRVQMVFQDPFGSLNPVHRIGHFLERAIVLHRRDITGDGVAAEMRSLMETVGLTPDMLDVYPHQLSGGQRQRVAIARALAVQPQVILADEPTSMLDVSIRIGVLNLMRRLRDERGIAMLYITHDLASARYVADRTLVLFAGELVEGGESLELMDAPDHPYTQLLLAAAPDPTRPVISDPEARARLRAAVLAATQCPHEDGTCSATEPVRHQLTPNHWVRCHLYRPRAAEQTALATENRESEEIGA